MSTLADLLGDIAWHERAACRPSASDVPSTAFVAELRPKNADRKQSYAGDPYDALKVCEACPVRQECGDYARQHHITFGVWGGQLVGRGPGEEHHSRLRIGAHT